MNTPNSKKPHPVDVHVGNRVRLRRLMLGISQVKLAEKIGLTFQQIQKYEKGANRICASRLFEFSQIFDVPIGYFFQDTVIEEANKSAHSDPSEDIYSISDFLSSRECAELNRAFIQIKGAKVRRIVLELVRSLGD